MSEELDALQHINTWDLVPLPSGVTPISCRWDYRLDVTNTFLHGDLSEDVYMTPPLGFSHPSQHFRNVVLTLGFIEGSHDYALFTGQTPRADITDLHTASTPIELHHRLSSSDGKPLPDPTRYHALFGVLVYLTNTRPDIAYVVRVLIQFVSAPHSTHYAALLRVLRYLHGTIFHSLLFSATSSLELHAYCNADWHPDLFSKAHTVSQFQFLVDKLSVYDPP
ncbi:uncharacterized mitochondrial protein AtMg00810-like [Dioscorea cayenensis subsp. rotundata]|uniref:Uncharacterized mitochondrial protein AtMg00810-like n=1 Tax=Dioscorea cayennensis subsp. rotundata TaxID=55577 RepID=A0AB40CVH1_DIOCR|nr:uncharacterized mitochondrial protein AtMg00810-like [Dioscorea cayenensis subsp. rotundata]